MTKQKNGNWKISGDEMLDIMICFFQGIENLENSGVTLSRINTAKCIANIAKKTKRGC